jgi:hypothetical protein
MIGKNMFSLTKSQQEKLNTWLAVQYKNMVEEQRKTMNKKDFKLLTENGKYPYLGAVGGGLTYCFTPTSIGVITVVKFMEEQIDLTDYELW